MDLIQLVLAYEAVMQRFGSSRHCIMNPDPRCTGMVKDGCK